MLLDEPVERVPELVRIKRAAVAQDNGRPIAREVARRKSVAAEAGRDLGALRALANETARRAISQSELKKHRRNAVTKVIVSTLAGVTSLWLMLDSPDFKDIQFITACVSLVVAAIWAGETFRTLLESFRAAAYDGPEVEAVDVDEETGLLIEGFEIRGNDLCARELGGESSLRFVDSPEHQFVGKQERKGIIQV